MWAVFQQRLFSCTVHCTVFLHTPRDVRTDQVIIVIHNDLLVKDKYLGSFAAEIKRGQSHGQRQILKAA